MITVEPLASWEQRHDFEPVEQVCEECSGLGDCECCGRECLTCGGTGSVIEDRPDFEIEQLYFHEVMDSLKRLCAFSSRHDFLTEAGDFIKANGRMDLPPWHDIRTTH